MRLLKRDFLNPHPITESVAVDAPPAVLYHLSESTLSHEQVRDALVAALRAAVPVSAGNEASYCWPREIYDDYVIYDQDGPQGQETYRRGYTMDGDGTVTLGDAQRVRIETSYVPIRESVGGGAVLEALDADGWNWRVQLIRAGTSQNNNTYDLHVLHEAAPAYAGVPVFAGRGRDHNPAERGFLAVAGYIVEAVPNNDGLEGRFEVNRGSPEVRDAVRHAFDVRARTGRDVMGFSHVVPQGGAVVEAQRPRGYRVKQITRVESVDIVMTPASGGALLEPLSESSQEAIVNLTELLARYRRGERLNAEEYQFLQESMQPAEFTALLAEAIPSTRQQPSGAAPLPATNPAAIDEATQRRIDQLEQNARLAESRSLLTARLAESRLPEQLRTAIAADFDGRIFEAAELDARITRDRDIAVQLAAVRPTGLGVQPAADQRDKWSAAMDAFFGITNDQGIRGFRSLKEAYLAINPDSRFSYIDEGLARAVLRDAAQVIAESMRPEISESIVTTTFGELWGDSITRRMLSEYNAPMYNSWRLVVGEANIVPLSDFRTQRRMRMGGYGELPTVPQGAPYQPLTSPGDEEATYAPAKKGGLEDLTLEAIANDDVGAARRIPVKLGRAAKRTLYNGFWTITILNNPTCTYDSVTLYHSSHGNTNTLALSAANLLASENAMRDQTAYGESGLVLGMANMPKFLVIPNELRDTAFRLTQSSAAVGAGTYSAEPNIFVGNGYVIIVVDEFTDANDWFLFADPANLPSFEVGFLNGREEPELFVQDMPTVGSVFTADKITYKIRHIWGIGILEHRGTYRNVASGG